MGKVDHEKRDHALLSCSGSNRWINCPPSARLEDAIESVESSDYTKEGTLAHEFGDIGLQLASKKITKAAYNKLAKPLKKSKFYSEEMVPEVQKYVDYVINELAEAKKGKNGEYAELIIEEKVDLTQFVEDGFGMCDSNIIADITLKVIDLKYGTGIKVHAKDNSQLMLYGLGALIAYDMLYNFEFVELTIMQPRLDHISTWTISVKDLLKWGKSIVKPVAELAFVGKGVQKAGDHCKWCKVKAQCATLGADAIKMAKEDFKKDLTKNPHLLNDKQLIEIYSKLKLITDYVKAVAAHVSKAAELGKKWPGYKIVAGKSSRIWTNEDMIKQCLQDELFSESQYMSVPKLLGITAIEKLVGKENFEDVVGEYVTKPQGKPTLVKDSDKRPELGSEDAVADFGKKEDDGF